MANISYQELTNTLQKSGLPFGDSGVMGLAKPFAQQQVMGQLQQEDPILAKQKSNYRAQIDRIAQMDQKLRGVYGDPSSKLYIEHAGRREGAITGAIGVEQKALGGIGDVIQNRQQEIKQTAGDIVEFYNKLVSEQKSAENKVKQLQKKGETASKKALDEAKRKADAVKKKTGQEVLDMTGIVGKDGQDFFRSSPAKFQESWLRAIQQGEIVPKSGYKLDDVKKNFEAWKKIAGEAKMSTKQQRGSLF